MVEVIAESAYPVTTPGPRVRASALSPFLREHGIDLRFFSHISDEEYRILASAGERVGKARIIARCAARVVRRSRPPDSLLMVHRLLSLVPVPGYDPPRRVDVYDFDDALLEGSISVENRAFAGLKREAERCRAHLRRARLVLAGNRYLATSARRYARHVEVVPSCVDPRVLTPRTHADIEVPTVGWMGSASTTSYLREILPTLAQINAGRVRLRLLAVGAGQLPSEPWIEQRPWTLASEADTLSCFDIGVMPMPDNPWTRGKCGYKLLQYYAAGVPAVASPVGVNASILSRGGGIPASTPEEWRAALEELRLDVQARRDAGGAGRRLVESEYSYQRWAPEIAVMLRSL